MKPAMPKPRTIAMLALAALLICGLCTQAFAGSHGHKAKIKKAILLVTFGTSVPRAQKVFARIDQSYKKAFPKTEIRWAYTAKFIRKKLAKRGQILDSPEEALAKLMAQGYNRVAVQSLHVIPGAEFHDLVRVVEGFRAMGHGFVPIVGHPLCSTTGDLKQVAKVLLGALPKERKKGEAVVFMGHGTHHPGGVVYPAMDYILRKNAPLVFMGTVEGYPELGDVVRDLKAAKVKTAWLLPFMTVAGDHAMNDMAGDEPDSWKSVLAKQGIKANPVLKAITEEPAMVEIWIKHTKQALRHLH